MLVVKIEVWPGGEPSMMSQVLDLYIVNTDSESNIANYSVYSEYGSALAGMEPLAKVAEHRRGEGAVVLLQKVLEALPERVA